MAFSSYFGIPGFIKKVILNEITKDNKTKIPLIFKNIQI